MEDYTEYTLSELFAESDAIGDKYLTAEEIAERDRKLEDVLLEISDLLFE